MKWSPKPVVALALLLGGCATNTFTQFYRDYTAGTPRSDLDRALQPYSGTTRIVMTGDSQKDTTELFRQNYAILGESTFEWGKAPSEEELREQARRAGADVVLYRARYPVGQGFAYDALFFRKRKASVAGLGIADLTGELRQALHGEKGVVVRYVREESPASRSDFRDGDVIVGIDGVQVGSTTDYIDKVLKRAGTECTFKVLRGGKELAIPIRLNALPVPAARAQ
ncbi:MAG: PDZ domain-containing protein [Opitutaceae bacterium]|jgi:hypothetical protein